jgi:hypothetical protein
VETTPSSEAIIFYWHGLTFQITIQVFGRSIPHTIVEKCAFVSILSSTTWQYLGCPQLVLVNQNILSFNKRIIEPLWILPQFLVTLGRKIVYIDVMVVHDPLDFTFILG